MWIVLFLIPTVLFFCTFYAYPIITIFISSFSDWRLASEIEFIGIDNYKVLLSDNNFKVGFVNTLKWLVIHWVFYVGLGLCVALLTANKSWLSKLVRTVYLIPNMIPIAALAFLFYFI